MDGSSIPGCERSSADLVVLRDIGSGRQFLEPERVQRRLGNHVPRQPHAIDEVGEILGRREWLNTMLGWSSGLADRSVTRPRLSGRERSIQNWKPGAPSACRSRHTSRAAGTRTACSATRRRTGSAGRPRPRRSCWHPVHRRSPAIRRRSWSGRTARAPTLTSPRRRCVLDIDPGWFSRPRPTAGLSCVVERSEAAKLGAVPDP